ncbi:Cell division control protein 53 [Spathaspora sp. JA1]|nr:Cell division control protein 53 [Spathaspora sp. JA1]
MAFPVHSDLDSTWNFIQPGLEFILGAQGDQGVTSQMYMNCYTAVYNYCVNKSRRGGESSLSSSTAHSSFSPNSENNSYSLAGSEIYSKLDAYLTQFIRGLKKEPHESLLEFYVRKWTRFTIGAVYMNNVFDYMNRYWVQKERSDGRRDIFDVNTLSLIKWRNEMFNPNSQVLIDEILNLIEKQRNNMIVDTSLISTAIKSLVFLSIDTNDLKKSNLVIYVNSFEKPFLKATEEYYTRESSKFLAEHNVVDYMKKCEARLSQEISRSNNYLEEHTKSPLLDTLNFALIKNHAQEMYDQFLILLEQNQIEHIQRMYKLLYRVPDTLIHLADTLEEYIKQEAGKTLEEIKVQAEAAAAVPPSNEGTPGVNGVAATAKPKRTATGGAAIDYKTYVNTLIAIYNQFNDVVIKAFSKDTRFIRSLDNACRHFVNKNPIATPTTRSNCKTPELLAKYADGFLKSTSKEADILDMNADNLMIVFKFINDKDAFEEHYRRSLAKRLINGTCKSDELEESIIHRLQEENSIEYTSKMTKMFSDMKASEDLKADVRNHVGENLVKEFNPLILAQSMWPFKYLDDYNLNVPQELQAPFEKVIEIYGGKHSGRQLKWLWNHGRAELKANLSRKGKPPFLFTVSNVQLMILIAFNKKNTYTVKELHEIVGTSRNIFEAHLLPFTKYKLIDQSPPSTSVSFNDDTVLTIVEEYKSKKLKVNFISNIKTNEPKQEEDEANKEIDETRKNFLSACIVRIMKSRKVCKHNDLINEVLPLTLSRFRARPLDVKRVIDQLIEKKYIKRIENATYEYMT